MHALVAQDKDASDINSTARVAAEKSDPKKASNEKKQTPQQPPKAVKNAPRFKPSEEIKEDYSVPFPVDI